MKATLKQVIPPFIYDAFKSSSKYGWFGNYSSWDEAKKNCSGYDSELILDKVKKAVLSVHNDEACFERDGILFYEEEYNWQLLSFLMLVAAQNDGRIHITDFGGSLGSSYYQHKKILSFLKELKWGIIEQSKFIEFGQKELQSNSLMFYKSIPDCLQDQLPQLLVFSSVLQYLEKPFELIDTILHFEYQYIFIDRTAFVRDVNHLITIQKVHPEIYNASYPAWFFNEDAFLLPFLTKYDLVASFENDDYCNKKDSYFKGFFLSKK